MKNEMPKKYVERTISLVKMHLKNAMDSEDGMVKVDYTFLRAVMKSFEALTDKEK